PIAKIEMICTRLDSAVGFSKGCAALALKKPQAERRPKPTRAGGHISSHPNARRETFRLLFAVLLAVWRLAPLAILPRTTRENCLMGAWPSRTTWGTRASSPA